MIVLTIFAVVAIATSTFAQSSCTTPNGERARCISFYDCQVFKNALGGTSRPSPEVIRFLRESECGHNNGPWVCCGSVARFESLSERPPETYRKPTPASDRPYRPPPSSSNGNPRRHKNFNLLPKNCGQQGSDNRIVGGNETQLDEFPWMALLEYRNFGQSVGHSCGGMLISEKYVLTAAHCVSGEILTAVGNPFRVRLGEHDVTTNRDCQIIREGNDEYEDCALPHQDIQIEQVIPHPSYNSEGQQFNDIALVRLTRPVRLNFYVQPVCLPVNGERSSVGGKLSVAGWGRTETSLSSNVKLKAQVPVVSLQECKSRYNLQSRRIIDKQFCAGAEQGTDSCRGDSGGPIMTTVPGTTPPRWYTEGIVSYGPTPCGVRGWPGVYTRVASYVNWILDNMRP